MVDVQVHVHVHSSAPALLCSEWVSSVEEGPWRTLYVNVMLSSVSVMKLYRMMTSLPVDSVCCGIIIIIIMGKRIGNGSCDSSCVLYVWTWVNS